MRRGLLWALAGTAGLSASALWFDRTPVIVGATLDRSGASRPFAMGPQVAAPSPLAIRFEPLQLEVARRDPFAPIQVEAPVLIAPPTAAVAPSTPVPVPPQLSWRYFGAMVTPEGQRLVMLAHGETTLTIQPGTRLDEGYVVEAIDTDAVRIIYPALRTVVNIPIPSAFSPAR